MNKFIFNQYVWSKTHNTLLRDNVCSQKVRFEFKPSTRNGILKIKKKILKLKLILATLIDKWNMMWGFNCLYIYTNVNIGLLKLIYTSLICTVWQLYTLKRPTYGNEDSITNGNIFLQQSPGWLVRYFFKNYQRRQRMWKNKSCQRT